MKRTVMVALLFGAGALALILAIVIGVAVSVGAGKAATTPMPSASVAVSPAPTESPTSPTPAVTAPPTAAPVDRATVVARRGINPLYQLIERSCDEPDSIDVDGWRIEGDTVIYRVSDYETDWSSTASTSFAALDAGGTPPVFITDAGDWQSNGCSP